MSGQSLPDIFRIHDGYVSDKWEQYLAVYESELRALVEAGKPLRLLEIGVQNGGSLQIWSKYLPVGSRIVGIDIDEKCASLQFDNSIQVFIGNAAEATFLDATIGDASFDIIVDDGSHHSTDIVASFKALLPKLNAGGKYFIEDLHASYWQSHGGGFRTPNSAIEYLKSLIDPLHFDYLEPSAGLETDDQETARAINRQVARISFYDSIAIIEKYQSPKEGCFRRVFSGKGFGVSGLTALKSLILSQPKNLVFYGNSGQDFIDELAGDRNRLQGHVGQLQAELVHQAAELAERTAELAELAGRTAEYHSTVERLQADLAERTAQYRSLLSSFSWRATAPLRILGERFPGFTRQLRRVLKLR